MGKTKPPLEIRFHRSKNAKEIEDTRNKLSRFYVDYVFRVVNGTYFDNNQKRRLLNDIADVLESKIQNGVIPL